MKNKKKLKEYETVWTCDFCGKEFKTKKESDKHERTCKKNLENKKARYWNIFYIIAGLLIIYFGWKIISFATSAKQSQLIPTPTPVLEPKINCSWDLKDDNGKLLCPDKLMTESECLNSTCCGLGVGIASVMSQAECAKAQADIKAKNNTQNNTKSDIVKCTFDPRCNQEPLMLKASVCKNTTCCNIALDYWVMTFTVAECKALQDKAIALYNSIYKNSPPLVLDQYVPAISQYDYDVVNVPTLSVNQPGSENQDYTATCNSQLQTDSFNARQLGGSAGEAMLELAQENFDRCMKTGNASVLKINQNIPSPTPTIVGIWYGNLGPL